MDSNLQPYRLFSFKDENHAFISCSSAVVNCAGLNRVEQLIGLTDFDMPWSAYADIYREHERDALRGNAYSTLFPLIKYNGETSIFLHTKYCDIDPITNKKRLVCYAKELVNPCIYGLEHLLSQARPSDVKNRSYAIGKKVTGVALSLRQQQCLFFILQGKSGAQIAQILGVSRRTVEHFIEIIKNKLKCASKSEIYDRAMEKGYFNIIPSGIMLSRLLAGLKHG